MSPTEEKQSTPNRQLLDNHSGISSNAPETNNQPSAQAQSDLQQQQQLAPVPAAGLGGNLLGAMLLPQLAQNQPNAALSNNAAGLLPQQPMPNQLMLMAQMLQPPQPQQLAGDNGNQLAQLMNIQQQQLNAIAQMNMFQAGAQANNVFAMSQLGFPAAQQQLNQLLLGLGGNAQLGGLLPIVNNQVPNAVLSTATTAAPTQNALALVQNAAASALPGGTLQEVNIDDPGWEDQFKALQRYRLVNGHTKVPARYKDNPKVRIMCTKILLML